METEENKLYKEKKCNQNYDLKGEFRNSESKKICEYSTETNNVYESESKKEIKYQELFKIKKDNDIDIDLNVIPDSADSKNCEDVLENENQFTSLLENKAEKEKGSTSDSHNHEKITPKYELNIIKTITNSPTKNSILTKDKQRIRVCRMAMNSIYNYLDYRCQRKGLNLEKVNVAELFGNSNKQKWFLSREIKILFASNPLNKKVIKKMIKQDLLFKKIVEHNFEDFYKNYFVKNYRKILIGRTPKYGSSSEELEDNTIFLTESNFKTFENCLTNESLKELKTNINESEKKENETYIDKLRTTGNNFIKDIKGEGCLFPRCLRKKFKTKICFIRYKCKK